MSAVILLVVALSSALAGGQEGSCSVDDVPKWIEAVRTAGEEKAYLCLADVSESKPALIEFLRTADSETVGARRVQRALALHVMQRLDGPADLESLRSINADDRRFLRDSVHARRGRESPIPAHHEVFSKFDWYAPSPAFRSNLLSDVDRANLKVIDKPPRNTAPAETVAPAVDAMPSASVTPVKADAEGGCGCSGVAEGLSASGLALAALWASGRRRDPALSV